MVNTYNPKEITIALGHHIVTGYAEDSFVSIDPSGDGVTRVVGCDGEVTRSISPDDTAVVKIVVQQMSPTNSFLQQQLDRDIKTGDGLFPILIKDLQGKMVFSSDAAWPVRRASRAYGRTAGNREWEIHTGSSNLTE